jgi:hypothetical protein
MSGRIFLVINYGGHITDQMKTDAIEAHYLEADDVETPSGNRP